MTDKDALEQLKLRADDTMVVVVDIQERLARAMPKKPLAQLLANTRRILKAADEMGLPVMVTEQYPKGLGPTVPEVADALSQLSTEPARLEKVDFSCMNLPEFRAWLEESGRSHLLLLGIETHVCIYQTARDIAASGRVVQVPRDAVASRHEHNFLTGLDLIARAGGIITSTEAALFDLMERAKGPVFKAVSPLFKE